MPHRKLMMPILALFAAALFTLTGSVRAYACGGFFCQNSPVDQNAERIIFTQNADGTVSAYIQIQYTGSAPDFSWILPLPSAITAEDVEVPEDAMAAFTELEAATTPVFIPPPFPETCEMPLMAVAESAESEPGDVTVFASGAVGPFGFDVVGSDDPTAMIFWLRDNEYRVTEEMEPLIDVYVEEKMVFLAMRLLPDKEASDVEPVKVTYRSDRPMIPLRLTAVAANPDMRVLTWIYADTQAVPENYAHIEIPDREIQFFTFGGNNYRALMGQKADEFDGQAFVTEYAAPTAALAVSHPLLQSLAAGFPYVTRLSTVISPEEMTVDPVFDYDPGRADVSNVHDLSDQKGVWDCEEAPAFSVDLPFINSQESGSQQASPENERTTISIALIACLGILLLAGVFGLAIILGRSRTA